MNVLIGCEYSGIVRDAFIDKRHHAVSCDLLPTESKYGNKTDVPSGGYVYTHQQGDILDILEHPEEWPKWDLIILHPPCTALCVSGNRWYGKGRPRHRDRLEAIEWTTKVWEVAIKQCAKVVLENPVSVIFKELNANVQYIQPWQFGHGETKKTGLALHGLPELQPTNIVEGRENRIHKMPPSKDRGKLRSLTYPGIAKAMADQWG
jgi:hypothetical protein